MELWEGIHLTDATDEERERVQRLLEGLTHAPFDRESAMLAGERSATLTTEGTEIEIEDVMIAAIALNRNEPILTGTPDHFERIEDADVETYCGGVVPVRRRVRDGTGDRVARAEPVSTSTDVSAAVWSVPDGRSRSIATGRAGARNRASSSLRRTRDSTGSYPGFRGGCSRDSPCPRGRRRPNSPARSADSRTFSGFAIPELRADGTCQDRCIRNQPGLLRRRTRRRAPAWSLRPAVARRCRREPVTEEDVHRPGGVDRLRRVRAVSRSDPGSGCRAVPAGVPDAGRERNRMRDDGGRTRSAAGRSRSPSYL